MYILMKELTLTQHKCLYSFYLCVKITELCNRIKLDWPPVVAIYMWKETLDEWMEGKEYNTAHHDCHVPIKYTTHFQFLSCIKFSESSR